MSTAIAERPARIVNHAKTAFEAPAEQPTAAELEAAMMMALFPPPPSLGNEGDENNDQGGAENKRQPEGQKGSKQKQQKKPESKQQKSDKSDGQQSGEQQKQDGQGEQGQQQQGEQQQGEQARGQQQSAGDQGEGQQGGEQASGAGQSGSPSGSGQGQGDQSAECQLEPEDRQGLPECDGDKVRREMEDAMRRSLTGEPDEQQGQGQGQGQPDNGERNNEKSKGGEHGHDNGQPTGEAEHREFDEVREDVGTEARVLANKKGEKVETILTNAQAVDHLRVTTNNFGRNLYAKYRQFGKLTSEQMFWAHKIAMESIHPKYKPTLI